MLCGHYNRKYGTASPLGIHIINASSASRPPQKRIIIYYYYRDRSLARGITIPESRRGLALSGENQVGFRSIYTNTFTCATHVIRVSAR